MAEYLVGHKRGGCPLKSLELYLQVVRRESTHFHWFQGTAIVCALSSYQGKCMYGYSRSLHTRTSCTTEHSLGVVVSPLCIAHWFHQFN